MFEQVREARAPRDFSRGADMGGNVDGERRIGTVLVEYDGQSVRELEALCIEADHG